MSSVTAIVDDQDRRIQYFGQWSNVGSFANAEEGTLSAAIVPGVGFSFQFNGSEIAVLGTVLPLNGTTRVTSSYSIDGATPSVFTAPNITKEADQVSFFRSPQLADGLHTLEVNVTSASSSNPYLIDLIGFIPTTTTPSGSYLTTSFAPPPTGSVIPANNGSGGSSSTDSHHSPPIGAIVGGVIGGVALIVITAIALYFLCGRRRNGQAYFFKSGQAADLLDQEVKPYDLDGTPAATAVLPTTQYQSPPPTRGPQSEYSSASSSAGAPLLQQSAPASAYGPASSGYAPSSSGYAPSNATTTRTAGPLSVVNAAPTTASPNQSQSKAAQAGILSVPQPVNYHGDSGIRFGSGGGASGSGPAASGSEGQDPVDVPPTYSEN